MYTKNVIGIDIGGTKIRAGLWNGKRLIKIRHLTTPKSQKQFVKTLRNLVTYYGKTNQRVTHIGIGIAGVVYGTTLKYSPNMLFLKNFDFRTIFSRFHKLKIDNDARAYARGEYLKGAGFRAKSLLVITLGTGIGRAFGKNGKIQLIKRFEYPEKWEKEYQKIKSKAVDSLLEVFLVEKLTPILKKYQPTKLVIGGGVTKARQGKFVTSLTKQFRLQGFKFTIAKAKLRDDAAILGAVYLFKK